MKTVFRHPLIAATFCTGMLLLTASAQADTPTSANSIHMIDSSVFNITEQEIASIQQRMQAAVDEKHIAGALLMVGNTDGVGMLVTAGSQGPADDTPVDQETIFRIYSMTKPIVSVAAMTLVQDGLLRVEDPVGKYIPEFNSMEVIDSTTGERRPARNVMTVEHLLTHQSGLIQAIFSPDTDLGKMYQEQLPADGSITALEMAKRLGGMPLFFEPGTAWHYGHSTDVLGAVLEVAAGKPLDQLLQERIFDPLGMDETSFYVPSSKASRIAEPIHGEMSDNTIVRPFLSGGGGLNSTTEDYVRFASMLLNGGEYRGVRILEEKTLDLMTEKRIGENVSREFFFYGNTGDWSMGFHLQPIERGNAEGPHNFGWRGIGGTLFLVDRENDLYVIYMEQKRGGPRGAPFDNNVAQRVVYEAIAD
jgi:CubicO group peptidase (beta-lactamase class C family)